MVYHLKYAIDLDAGSQAVEWLLKWLKGRFCDIKKEKPPFDDRLIMVDTNIFNPDRICTVYGTAKRKGEDTPERPHRIAFIEYAPESLEVVPAEILADTIADLGGTKKTVLDMALMPTGMVMGNWT